MLHYARDKKIVLKKTIGIGQFSYRLDDLPEEIRLYPELGVAANSKFESLCRIHLDEFSCHPRTVITLNGEVLLFYAAGSLHYGWMHLTEGSNTMYMRRSCDGGSSWSDPQVAWSVPYGQHAAVPLRPRNEKRIYVFTTEPSVEAGYTVRENAPLAMRFSDDDGRTWSMPEFIRPGDYPDFQGMTAMRAEECGDNIWLLGAHNCEQNNDSCCSCAQYLLRTCDSGKHWQLLPGRDGWTIPGGRLHEGRPLYLGNREVLMFIRSSEGHLWSNRSFDNGLTWSNPTPTKLKHLEAPPMLFKLADGTLAAFIHNRSKFDNAVHEFAHEIRSELYVCISHDCGHTWSNPVFMIAEAGYPPVLSGWGCTSPMVSYADLLESGGMLHLFIDHEMRQVLQLSMQRSIFDKLTCDQDLEEVVKKHRKDFKALAPHLAVAAGRL